ncbi:MAG TPA: PEP-CTERM sorting domain-containing protein [Fimbriiglobus sp.]|jgi:hypothetical protein
MISLRNAGLAILFYVATSSILPAQTTLFQDNFDTNTAGNWSVNSVAGSTINTAAFAFDYSTVGIPAAPGGTTTLGLKLQANVNPSPTDGQVTGTFSGISVSPLGKSFTGDYTLRFQAWQNAPGPFPGGGAGSTQMTGGGLGAVTTTAQFPGTAVDGVYFNASGEGGTATDYRAYVNVGAPIANTTPGVYAAGTQAGSTNNTDPYYQQFGGISPPAAQTTLFPQQTGTTMTGTLGFAWHQWDIAKSGNIVTWSVDGKLIATVDITTELFAGDNIFLGQYDINATTTTGADRDLLFGLIDNVMVFTPVPEPASILGISAAGLAGLGWLRRRVMRRAN